MDILRCGQFIILQEARRRERPASVTTVVVENRASRLAAIGFELRRGRRRQLPNQAIVAILVMVNRRAADPVMF